MRTLLAFTMSTFQASTCQLSIERSMQDIKPQELKIRVIPIEFQARISTDPGSLVFVIQAAELAVHNGIAQQMLQQSLESSDGAVLVGLKQCQDTMRYVLAAHTANKGAQWAAQLQRLRDQYEDMLESQKLVGERLLAQRQAELERWQERVEQLERPASRFLG